MVSAAEAFNLASSFCPDPLSKTAFDYGDKWVFCYGGTTPFRGFWPVFVKKDDGIVGSLAFNDAFAFANRKDTLPRIEVKT